MLSAVAARKAALAAQAQLQTEVSAASSPVASGSNTETPSVPPKNSNGNGNGLSKRKKMSQKSRPDVTKRQKKVKPVKSARMKLTDFEDQVEVIMIGDSDEEDSDSAYSMLEEYADEQAGIPSIKRAWSPSQPVEDSSDDDISDPVTLPLDISSLFPRSSHQQTPAVDDDARPMSTLEPITNQNVFSLSESEISQLGLEGPTTLVGFTTGNSLCLLGTCKLTVLQGSLTLLGTTVSSSRQQHTIFAPRSSPLPILRAGRSSPSHSILKAAIIPETLTGLLQFEAVIAIQENKSGVQGLGRICRTFEGVFEASRWQKSSTIAPFAIPGIFMITHPQQSKDIHAFSLPPTWSNALDNANVSKATNAFTATHVIKGPKNSGKSTFARTLLNRLLGTYRQVAYLECDIGQSEFTPGGMVSLNVISTPIFGPPFTHPTLPNFAHFIGSITPRSNPSHYLEAVQALMQTYRLDIQTPPIEVTDNDDEDSRIQDLIPLVVNTMGWAKGLGADLNQRIESIVDGTHIYDIQAPARDDYTVSTPAIPISGTYGAHYSHTIDASTAPVYVLESISSFSSAAGYTAADHRSLSILSYLHTQFPLDAVPGELGQVTAKTWDTEKPLCAIPPYEIDCRVALDKVVLTGSGSEDVVEEEIGRVMNGAVVGLVACEPGTVDVDSISQTDTGIPYTRQYSPPSPTSSNCVGIALVRGVSPPKNVLVEGQEKVTTAHLQLLTPLPHPLLAQSRVLVKGELELPVWGMLDFRNFGGGKDADMGDVAGVEREKVPFLQWGKAAEGVMGAEKRRVRRNLMRRGQM